MALVMLPCDMPWWDALQNLIKNLASAQNVDELISEMGAIFTMCNVGLDPDEQEGANPHLFVGLKTFLQQDFTQEEREHFFKGTLTIIIKSALHLKSVKPVDGLKFSLQQEANVIEIEHDFACSLIAHAFLSTFPKRTHKTHPSLQDFNFTFFHRHLNQNSQKLKLRSIFHYFNLQSKLNVDSVNPPIRIRRQVMKSSYPLTMDDWLKCDSPLCCLNIKHDNHMENVTDLKDPLFVCFSSMKVGGKVLSDGASMECIRFVTSPELLTTLLFVEALHDNEALIIENLITVGKISISKSKQNFEPVDSLKMLNICCMDAENYTHFPTSQYENNSLLRELNKALLAFHREQFLEEGFPHRTFSGGRLSPIGEFSFSVTPMPTKLCISANRKLDEQQTNEEPPALKESFSEEFFAAYEYSTCSSSSSSSSTTSSSQGSSSVDEFYSTRTSLTEYEQNWRGEGGETNYTNKHHDYHADEDDSDDDEKENVARYSGHLDTTEHRRSFAEELRKALRQSASVCSKNSSYAVDISVTGSSIGDPNIRMKRGGSWGFTLEENSFHDDHEYAIAVESNEKSPKPPSENCIRNSHRRRRRRQRSLTANDTDSSRYSFSSEEDNSNFEDIYEELIRWLDEQQQQQQQQSDSVSSIVNDREEEDADGGKPRNAMIARFAASLLKRTLSESFVGIPLTDDEAADRQPNMPKRNATALLKVRMLARSLSLQLAKQKHKSVGGELPLSATFTNAVNSAAVVTGNWGCGSRNAGDPQLKFLIQWLAGSVADVSQIVYYTRRNPQLLKLDTVCRVLVDRRWNVGELLTAIIQCIRIMRDKSRHKKYDAYNSDSLFHLLISVNENSLIGKPDCCKQTHTNTHSHTRSMRAHPSSASYI